MKERGTGRTNVAKEGRARRARKKMLRTFGMTEADYNRLFNAQQGGCAICWERQHGRRLAVDHNHKTGIARGLLCVKCNAGLGMFKDDAQRLGWAIDYLREHR